MAPKVQRPRQPAGRSALSFILGDASVMVITVSGLCAGLWVFLSAVFEELTAMLAAQLDVPPLAASLTILCTGLAIYEPICTAVGGKGACFNPSQNFAFAAAGKGKLRLHIIRSIAQTAGGVLGAAAAIRTYPSSWQGKFFHYAHGVSPGTSLLGGVIAEAVLSFFLNVVILWSMGGSFNFPHNGTTQLSAAETSLKGAAKFAPYIATIILIPLGARLTGPFMNPAFAFSWFYHLQGLTLTEHVLVYWVGCLAGSYLAGIVWWLLTSPARKARSSNARLAASKRASAAQPKKVAVEAGGRVQKNMN